MLRPCGPQLGVTWSALLALNAACHRNVDRLSTVNISLTAMTTEQRDFAHVVDMLLTNVRDLLNSPNVRDRVRAIHALAAGVEALERQVLLDAQAAGMTWAEIGGVYGVSRQAAHRRFSDETVVPADFFDGLLKELDEPGEVVPALARAANRARPAAATR